MLRDHCRSFRRWQELLNQAEREGMAPLLQKHLMESGADVPSMVKGALNILTKRHQKQAGTRLAVLNEVLTRFAQKGLTPILIKGAALAETLYPAPSLRPMRDMDILFDREEAAKAHALLLNSGFEQLASPQPTDHYHLPPLYVSVDNQKICLELHSGLYPHCPPWYPEVDFSKLHHSARTVQIAGHAVSVLNHEESLHYLYQHGLRGPLTYENYKLINIADLIGYTEQYYLEIDWELIKKKISALHRALPLLHHVSPWNSDQIPEKFFPAAGHRKELTPIPFRGWPQRRIKELKGRASLGSVLKETLFPSSWWVKTYYGCGYSFWRLIKACILDHPRNVLWWLHLYSHFVIQTNPELVRTARGGHRAPVKYFFISTGNKIRGILRKAKEMHQKSRKG